MQMAMNLSERRRHARQLLDDTSSKDAPSACYALFHDPQRSALYTSVDVNGQAQGFVGVFQTGQDLFRPLMTMVCQNVEVAQQLFQEALTPGRPYIFFANLNQLPLVDAVLRLENQQILQILRLDSTRFQPRVNVLVVHSRAPNGTPRCEIDMAGIKAVAGVNWQSPGFAEIYVQVDPEVQGRGWGKHVVAALTDQLLREGRQPIYLVESRNEVSRQLAESLGYIDTGYRQVYADAVYVPELSSQDIDTH